MRHTLRPVLLPAEPVHRGRPTCVPGQAHDLPHRADHLATTALLDEVERRIG